MLDLLFKVILLGIASTVSPVIFGVILSLLAAKHYPKQRALACFAGGVLTVLIISSAGWAIGSDALSFGDGFSHYLGYVDILLGVLFIIFAVSSLIAKKEKKPKGLKTDEKTALPHLKKWFAIGFLLNITNFDAVLLFFTEAREIFQASILFLDKLLLLILGSLFFLLPALLPILVYITMPKKSEQILKPIGKIMEKYGKYLVAVIFLAFGVYLLYRGIGIIY